MGFRASEHDGDDEGPEIGRREPGAEPGPALDSPQAADQFPGMTRRLLGSVQDRLDAIATTSASIDRAEARRKARERQHLEGQIADRDRAEAERPAETRRKRWSFRLAVWGAVTGTVSMILTGWLLVLNLTDDEPAPSPGPPRVEQVAPVPLPAVPTPLPSAPPAVTPGPQR